MQWCKFKSRISVIQCIKKLWTVKIVRTKIRTGILVMFYFFSIWMGFFKRKHFYFSYIMNIYNCFITIFFLALHHSINQFFTKQMFVTLLSQPTHSSLFGLVGAQFNMHQKRNEIFPSIINTVITTIIAFVHNTTLLQQMLSWYNNYGIDY